MSVFGAKSTTDEVLSGVDLHGKRALITGVSAGLGIETARALVAHGADVMGMARDLRKAEKATVEVQETAAKSGGSFEVVELDLADLRSVHACANSLVSRGNKFDVVIANAGVMATPQWRTEDGFDMQFGTNHLGHFLLTNRIASLIRGGGRVVSLSSSGHRYAKVDLNDPNFDHTEYQPFLAYGRSKTANILFAVEFDRRHKHRGVRATAVHPGVIPTELSRHMSSESIEQFVETANKMLAEQGQPPMEYKTLSQGAATSVWAGIVASGDEVGGKYCENCHVASPVADDAAIAPSSEGVRDWALNLMDAAALWKKSEEMVGETF